MSNVMKLSLNYPALERLLGGDSELETELRHNIAKQFTKDYLKPLMETETLKQATKEINDAIKQGVNEKIGEVQKHWSNTKFSLAPEFKAALDQKLTELVNEALDRLNLNERFEKAIQQKEQYWIQYAERAAVRILDAKIEERIQDGIKKRLAVAAASVK